MKVFGVYCYKCRHFVYSRARHDYRVCKCWEKKNYSGVAIDGGQSDYFKVSQGSDATIRFLKIEIDKTEEDLIKDWKENINDLGMIYIENINKTNESNIKKFKKIEEEIRSEEKDLIAKKNVLSEEEFSKGLTSLRKKIEDYREVRQKAIDEITKKRINASADFAQKIKPILGNYAKEKNIDMVVQKKNIIMGKSELDITDEILKIVDKEISKLKIN